MNVRTRDQSQDEKKVVDTYSTVMGNGLSSGGGNVQGYGEMLDLFCYFDNPAAVGEANQAYRRPPGRPGEESKQP